MALLEFARGPRGRFVAAGLVVVLLTAAGLAVSARLRRRDDGPVTAARAIPGERERVVVEVLNASAAVGLARDATRRLRDAGIDVVYFGSDTTRALDSTEVLVRRGDAAAGERVARVLGSTRVRPAPDPRRLVDVTVRLGRDFATRVRVP